MCQEKYNFELNAVEIVENHVHLVISTLEDGETISRIMQYIKARTAEKYNKRMNRSGAFWVGRFGCKIVEEAKDPVEYLNGLLWYVGYNPVRKNMSIDPRENYIGFINCYLIENYQLPIKITLHPYYLKLGNTFDERVRKFLLYEKAYLERLATQY
jgi:REP element-mobilizing transposase RayT